MGWREKALAEIGSIKVSWANRYSWTPEVRVAEQGIDLFVHFTWRRANPPDGEPPEKTVVLRLRYQDDFETAGRREAFVNPEDYTDAGPGHWPVGVSGFNPTNSPPAICLEGTWGFHSSLHRDRDGRKANLNKLLLEIQRCLNP